MTKLRVLYIGNDNSAYTGYTNTMETLSSLLVQEDVLVYRASKKRNKVLRLLDMLWHVFKYRKKVDVVLIDTFSTINFYFALLCSQLARLLGKDYIPILHGGNLPYRLKSWPYFSDLIFSNSKFNVAPSGYLTKAFEEFNYPVEYIPNVLEIDKYQYFQRGELRPNILWVRAFKDIYNPTMAIEVLRIVRKTNPNAKLCMIGPIKDSTIDDVKKMILDSDLSEAVEITGALSKKEWIHRSKDFDIFINTTNVDNTPVSVMEIMGLGLPIVSTNVGGIPYLLENDKEALLVNKNDPEEMAKKILFFLDSKNITKVHRMTDSARDKVESFGWKVVKSKWFEVLK